MPNDAEDIVRQARDTHLSWRLHRQLLRRQAAVVTVLVLLAISELVTWLQRDPAVVPLGPRNRLLEVRDDAQGRVTASQLRDFAVHCVEEYRSMGFSDYELRRRQMRECFLDDAYAKWLKALQRKGTFERYRSERQQERWRPVSARNVRTRINPDTGRKFYQVRVNVRVVRHLDDGDVLEVPYRVSVDVVKQREFVDGQYPLAVAAWRERRVSDTRQ